MHGSFNEALSEVVVIGQAKLSYDELLTAVTEVEAIILLHLFPQMIWKSL